jgi:hypothetical protein
MCFLTPTLIAVLVLSLPIPARAQWIKLPTPGIPRTATGDADLSAPVPRAPDGRPDLSGVWGWQPGRYFMSIAADLKPEEITPWARDFVVQRMERLGKDDPAMLQCLPQGPRLNLFAPIPVKIVQTPRLIVILSEDLTYRQIFVDGRLLPEDPDPSFMGYSVGRWEDATLVVESIGFKDRTWLDFSGLPHSEALRITERIRRTTFGHLEIEETLTDPAVFTKPVTVTLGAQFVADTDLLEYVCAENEKSREHIVGTASELIKSDLEKAVYVSPDVLAKYVGTYDFRIPENPTTPMLFPITLREDRLFLAGGPLVPLSETVFAAMGTRVEMVIDRDGVVTHLLMRTSEGDSKAVRLADPK